jgi:hypothetical protein
MEEPERYCAYQKCKKLLVKRADETKQNWGRRKTCDKQCAALHRQEELKGQKREQKPVARAGKRKYKKVEPITIGGMDSVGLSEMLRKRMMRGALR